MKYIATRKTFTRIHETSGTLQNTSKISDVEVSNKAIENTGIILSPQDRFSFSNATLYVRCVGGGGAEIRVVPFIIGSIAASSTVTEIWRYENAGIVTGSLPSTTLANLPETQSRTSVAFCPFRETFSLPDASVDSSEIWAKFDVYCTFDTTTSGDIAWHFQLRTNQSEIYIIVDLKRSGIRNAHYSLDRQFPTEIKPNPFELNQLQTVLMHVIADGDDGVVEIWVDEEKVGDYHGTVNKYDGFTQIEFLSGGDSRILFSNIIVSNGKIDFDEVVSTTPTPSDPTTDAPTTDDPTPSDPTIPPTASDNDVDELIADALNGNYTSEPDADSVIDDMLNNTDPIDTGDGFSDFVNELFP